MPQIYISDIIDAYLTTNEIIKGEIVFDLEEDDEKVEPLNIPISVFPAPISKTWSPGFKYWWR